MNQPLRKPEWLKIRIRHNADIETVRHILDQRELHTVCGEANCPNLIECYSKRTATFMILGAICTRNCRFCNVASGSPQAVDTGESFRVLEAVRKLGLRYVVITSVTRDDLDDGGASAFAATVRLLKAELTGIEIEVLIPDFQGNEAALRSVVEAGPDILNHNVETVPRLYSKVRPQAHYRRSVELIGKVKNMDKSGRIRTKSGIMVGLGESITEVESVFQDLRAVDCDFLTVGQYLSPSKEHLPVIEYVRPETFDEYRTKGLALGFRGVASGPFVRSSYRAAEMFNGETSVSRSLNNCTTTSAKLKWKIR